MCSPMSSVKWDCLMRKVTTYFAVPFTSFASTISASMATFCSCNATISDRSSSHLCSKYSSLSAHPVRIESIMVVAIIIVRNFFINLTSLKSNFMLFREIAQTKQVSQSRRHMQLASSRYWFLIQCFQNTLQQISTRPKCVSPPWLIPCGQPHIPQSHHGSETLCRNVHRHTFDTSSRCPLHYHGQFMME